MDPFTLTYRRIARKWAGERHAYIWCKPANDEPASYWGMVGAALRRGD